MKHRTSTNANRIAAALLLCAAPLAATQIIPVTLAEMEKASDIIVHAKVTGKTMAWDDERRVIWTHYDLAPIEFLKGQSNGPLRVSEPGGTDGQVEMKVPGAPEYKIGEEVVVFLEPTDIGYHRTCGWTQGKFQVSQGTVQTKQATQGLPGFKAKLRALTVREGSTPKQEGRR